MKLKKRLCMILTLIVLVPCFGVNVSAAEKLSYGDNSLMVVRATGKFDMEVPGLDRDEKPIPMEDIEGSELDTEKDFELEWWT